MVSCSCQFQSVRFGRPVCGQDIRRRGKTPRVEEILIQSYLYSLLRDAEERNVAATWPSKLLSGNIGHLAHISVHDDNIVFGVAVVVETNRKDLVGSANW